MVEEAIIALVRAARLYDESLLRCVDVRRITMVSMIYPFESRLLIEDSKGLVERLDYSLISKNRIEMYILLFNLQTLVPQLSTAIICRQVVEAAAFPPVCLKMTSGVFRLVST